MKRPKFLRNYTPPPFDEMAAALPDVERATLAQYYDLMCLAMACKAYDRSGARERLRGIADAQKRLADTVALIRTQAEAEECLLMFDRSYALWQQGVKATWDGQVVDDARAEVRR